MDQRRGAHCGILGMAFLLVLSLGATPRLSSVVPLPLSYPGGWATRCRVNLGAGENVPKRRAIVPPLPVEPPSVGVAGYILGENSVESVVEAYKNGSFVLLAEDGEEDARISLMINPEAVVATLLAPRRLRSLRMQERGGRALLLMHLSSLDDNPI